MSTLTRFVSVAHPALFRPLRMGVTRLPRGHPLRSACLVALRPFIRAYRNHLARHMTEFRPLDAPDLVFGVSDSQVIETVYWLGVQGYEGLVADVWAALCRDSRSVLEVGGNVGLFTVIGGRATQGAYTVLEPVPEIAAMLTANLSRNGLLGKVVLEQAAALPGPQERMVVLNVPDERRGMPTGAHLIEGSEVAQRTTERTVQVRGLPIRDLMVGRDLVKIDAEGIEATLLDDVQDLIAAHRPTLMLEVLPEATHLAQLIARMAEQHGYRISVIPQWGVGKVTEISPGQFGADVPGRYHSKDIVLSVRSLADLKPAPRG